LRETITENKMGVAPVWSLLLKMALPVILSTAVQALYNIVDGIFVAMISEKALSAITYAMPMVTLLTALSTGIAVGMNTMLSRALGEKIQQEVNDAAEAAVFLVMITGAVSLVTGFTRLPSAFMNTQTADLEIFDAGIKYLKVCYIFGIGTIAQLFFERMLISTGKTLYSMISQLVGAVLNIVIDPILIFGLFDFPEMGIIGAAVATVLSQITAAGIALFLNTKKTKRFSSDFR
jgi:MATE efflux family protein